MIRVQFRIRPVGSIEDIDPELIRSSLTALEGIHSIDLFDDRASDATFVTVVVTFSSDNKHFLEKVMKTLTQNPEIVPYVVDKKGSTIRLDLTGENIPDGYIEII
jgi:hypothetical protein